MASQTGRAGDADTPASVTSPAIHTDCDVVLRPLLGYLCVPFSMPDKKVEHLRRALAAYASREGFVLLRTFVDRRLMGTNGFTALFRALASGTAHHVVVPALHHFARARGIQLVIKELIEQQTGAHVLVMYPSLEESA